jgi:hypothetical protein
MSIERLAASASCCTASRLYLQAWQPHKGLPHNKVGNDLQSTTCGCAAHPLLQLTIAYWSNERMQAAADSSYSSTPETRCRRLHLPVCLQQEGSCNRPMVRHLQPQQQGHTLPVPTAAAPADSYGCSGKKNPAACGLQNPSPTYWRTNCTACCALRSCITTFCWALLSAKHTAHSERQEVWAGPSWSSCQQCIPGVQLSFTWHVRDMPNQAYTQPFYIHPPQSLPAHMPAGTAAAPAATARGHTRLACASSASPQMATRGPLQRCLRAAKQQQGKHATGKP